MENYDDSIQNIIKQAPQNLVGRLNSLYELEKFVMTCELPNYMCILGSVGLGKTALLSTFAKNLLQQDVNVFLFFSSMAGLRPLDDLIQCMAWQLKQKNFLTQPLSIDMVQLRRQVYETLNCINKHCVVIIDGIDEMKTSDLSWLQGTLAFNIRVILSATPSTMWQQWQDTHSVFTHELTPFTDSEISSIAQEIDPNLSPELLNILIQSSQGCPLYLRTALSAIQSGHLTQDNLPSSLQELMHNVIESLSQKHTHSLVSRYCALLDTAGYLRTEYLADILHAEALQHDIEPYLISNNNLVSLSPLLRDHFDPVECYKINADYLENQVQSIPEHWTHFLYYLCQSKQYTKVLSYLTDINYIESLVQHSNIRTLLQELQYAIDSIPKDVIIQKDGSLITVEVLNWIQDSIRKNSDYLTIYPEQLFSILWNYCYWSEATSYINEHDISQNEDNTNESHTQENIEQNEADTLPFIDSKTFAIQLQQNKKDDSIVWLEAILKPSIYYSRETPILCTMSHNSAITAIALHPNGQYLATATRNNVLFIWNVETGELIHTKTFYQRKNKSYQRITAIAFHEKTPNIAVGTEDGEVHIMDTNIHKVKQTVKVSQGSISAIAYSPNGLNIVIGTSDDTLARIFSFPGMNLITRLERHEKTITDIAYSPDGKYIATASMDHDVYVWDALGNFRLACYGHSQPVKSITFSPNSNKLATASLDGTIRIWDVSTGRPLQILQGHSDRVYCIAYNPKINQLLSVGLDHTMRLWNATENIATFAAHQYNTIYVQYTPNTSKIITAGDSDGLVHVWDTQRLLRTEKQWHHEGHITKLCFSPTQLQLATVGDDATLKVWNIETKQLYSAFYGHSQAISAVSYNPDGTFIATGSYDNTVRIWDVSHREPLFILQKHHLPITQVCYSYDGTLLASVSRDTSLILWNPADGTQLEKYKQDNIKGITSAVFHPIQDQIAIGTRDGHIYLWDLQHHTVIANIDLYTHDIINIAFDEDGKHIAATDIAGNTRILEMDSEEKILQLKGHVLADTIFTPNRYYAMIHNNVTAICNKDTGEPVAYYPLELYGVQWYKQNILAGYHENTIYCLKLHEHTEKSANL